ncbi:hypothetical protein [Aeromicrobium sp. NPDC092404]|uniref:hypothetical protein n=1 Tax=Aeromicrobium sp. NPDC092404 TaxID=3154976 RepID=UPI00341DF37D
MRAPAAATLVVAAVLLAGCSSGNDDAATRTVERLHASLRAGDGAAACQLLSDEAQQELAESKQTSCAEAVIAAGIPDTGRVRDVSVYGTAAQVRYAEDVVFLGEFEDGWRVTAAGCTEAVGAPYDCDVQGG